MFPPWSEAKKSEQGLASAPLPEPRRPCLVCQMRFAAANRLPQPSRCLLCKAAVTQSEMIEHIKEMHLRLHRCGHCDRAFGSPEQLEGHVRESHPLQQPAPPAEHGGARWTCEYCRRVFTYEAVWRLHLGIHSGPQPYFCVRCKRRMATQGELDAHLRECGPAARRTAPTPSRNARTRNAPYAHQNPVVAAASEEASPGNGAAAAAARPAELACPLCSKRYKKKKYLTNHIAAHSAGKRYCCERCGRAYLFKGFMLKHMLAVHNVPPKATSRPASH
ncbi:zinc finger protein 425-like isoform X2 [Ixodes scapularis]